MAQTEFPDVHKIPVPTPFPIGPVNVYFLEGEYPALVDTGVGYEEGRRYLESALKELGYGFRDIRRVFLTHGHDDHVGLAGMIEDESGAEVYIHPADRPKVEIEASGSPWGRDRNRFERFFRFCGVPTDFFKISEQMRARYRDALGIESHGVREVQTIDDGDQLLLGNRTLRVIHCPRHTPGVTCLFDEADGILFSGDHILKSITPNPTLEITNDETFERFKSLAHYLDSLRKLRDLQAGVTFTGHGEDIEDLQQSIEGLLKHHEKRNGRIVDILTRHRPATIYQVTKSLFKGLEPFAVPLAISETVAHLDVLEMEGRIQCRVRDGLAFYAATSP